MRDARRRQSSGYSRVVATLTAKALYCDESRTNGGGPFFLGALDCSVRRAELLDLAVRRLRAKHSWEGEFKWTKVSARMLPVYEDFVSPLLVDRYTRLMVMRVERTPEWYGWAKTHEERFFRTYYAFLRKVMKGWCRYDVHLDHVQAKRLRWDSLRHALRQAAVRDDYTAGRRLVPRLLAENSKESNLLQLADVALGAWTACATSPHKAALQQRVRQDLAERVTEWTFTRTAPATR